LGCMLVNTEHGEMFSNLEKQISNFDSDSAREIIHAIKKSTGCGEGEGS